MSPIVADAIAAGVAELEHVVDVPTGALGYGTDLGCDSDLAEAMDDVSDTLVLAQALARRLDCPRGALPDDAGYGVDLRGMCNRGVTDRRVRELADLVRVEVQKDDRVDSASVTVMPASDGSALAVKIVATPRSPTISRFSLTLSVTSAAVLIAELQSA